MSNPTLAANATGLLSTVYATDEHVAIRARGDFVTLCPEWQTRAAGADGVIASGSPWTLTSASVDFQALGVQAGNVILLQAPKATFSGVGQLLAVESVSAGSATLRRIGEPAGVGQPPAAAGATAVVFKAPTMGAQIEEASFNLNVKWGLDARLAQRAPSLVYDLRVLRRACVLRVLYDAYSSEIRGNDGDFPLKLRQLVAELREVDGLIQLRWGAGGDSQPSTTLYGGRVTR